MSSHHYNNELASSDLSGEKYNNLTDLHEKSHNKLNTSIGNNKSLIWMYVIFSIIIILISFYYGYYPLLRTERNVILTTADLRQRAASSEKKIDGIVTFVDDIKKDVGDVVSTVDTLCDFAGSTNPEIKIFCDLWKKKTGRSGSVPASPITNPNSNAGLVTNSGLTNSNTSLVTNGVTQVEWNTTSDNHHHHTSDNHHHHTTDNHDHHHHSGYSSEY